MDTFKFLCVLILFVTFLLHTVSKAKMKDVYVIFYKLHNAVQMQSTILKENDSYFFLLVLSFLFLHSPLLLSFPTLFQQHYRVNTPSKLEKEVLYHL